MPLAQHDDVVEALPADRSDEAFAVRILPRRPRRRDALLDAHRLDAPHEDAAKDLVTVTQ